MKKVLEDCNKTNLNDDTVGAARMAGTVMPVDLIVKSNWAQAPAEIVAPLSIDNDTASKSPDFPLKRKEPF